VLISDHAGGFQAANIGDEMVGNGMGVVAFLLEDSALPSVFVGVDQQPNLFGTVLSNSDDDSFRIEMKEEAIVRGLAYDSGGNAQACMGIAAGDANADGAVDLFVTNFYLEYYTLYLQQQGLFRDATASSNTISHTRPLLGFGTQFLDVQLDGHLDLFVLNGHIDDHSHIGIPEEMASQLFLGSGDGRFTFAPEAGDYFQTPRLGRALAKLDFDQDGMIDLVGTDLELPVSLVHNESLPSGSFLKLRLVGTQSERNAYCTRAELILTEGQSLSNAVAPAVVYRQSQQLVAGGGYQATNERVLHFSVPDKQTEAKELDLKLKIRWPSGIVEEHEGVKLGEQYTAIEKQGIYLTP
jgi:hypothetical protein